MTFWPQRTLALCLGHHPRSSITLKDLTSCLRDAYHSPRLLRAWNLT